MTSFSTRYLIKRTVYTDNFLLKKDDENRQLQSVQVANCLAMMNQLSCIVRWSSEIFNNVLQTSQETANRITKVKKRVEKLKSKVPDVESLFMNQSPGYFYDQENPHIKSWRRKEKRAVGAEQMPFNRVFAPDDVNRLRKTAEPLPDLHMVDKYMDDDDKKAYKSCIKKYSMPEFFENEWVKKEHKRIEKIKAERKQRKRKKKRYGKAKRVIEAVETKQYSATGEKKTIRGKKTILEGDRMEIDVEVEEYGGRRTTVTDRGLQEPARKTEISRLSNPPSGKKSPSSSAKVGVIPEETAVGVPPPVPRNPSANEPGMPPPAPVGSQSGGIAGPPSFVPPAEAAVSNVADEPMPEDMKQFKKMLSIMRNPYAVINRMKVKKYTEEDFKKWIDPTWEISEAHPSRKKTIKKQPPKIPVDKPKPTSSSGRSNLLAGIRAGANLKKAGERQVKQLPKKPLDKKSQLLNAIQQGTKLKKVTRNRKKEETKEVEDAMMNNPVMALLRLREKMAMTDSEDDSSDESSDEWED